LYGVDTPEVFGVKKGRKEWKRGIKASEFVKSVLKENDEVIIETIKDTKEKFGRYLAVIFLKVEQSMITDLKDIRNMGDLYCLNDILIEKGFAKKYLI
jgi:micrococcal nuclease